MAQERHVSPEKQLLNLIEDPKEKSAGAKSYSVKHRSRSLFSFAAWRGRFSFFKERIKGGSKKGGSSQLNIKSVNRVLGLCSFVLAFYFIGSLSLSMNELKDMEEINIEFQKDVKSAVLPDVALLKRSVSYYLEKVRGRDIFEMGEPVITEETVEAKTEIRAIGVSSGTIEATQNFKLVGISWSNDPDAMIEDSATGRTFFVKRGQMIGEIKVEAIFKDKVVLSYGGEEIELK